MKAKLQMENLKLIVGIMKKIIISYQEILRYIQIKNIGLIVMNVIIILNQLYLILPYIPDGVLIVLIKQKRYYIIG